MTTKVHNWKYHAISLLVMTVNVLNIAAKVWDDKNIFSRLLKQKIINSVV